MFSKLLCYCSEHTIHIGILNLLSSSGKMARNLRPVWHLRFSVLCTTTYSVISSQAPLVPAFKSCSEAESAKQYSKTGNELRNNWLQGDGEQKVPMWCSPQRDHGHSPTHTPHMRLENISNRNSLANTCFLISNGVMMLLSLIMSNLSAFCVSSYSSSSVSVWSRFAKLWAWCLFCAISAWAGTND